jgi:membrane protease YdiL (CAAX protease family)
MGMIKRRLDLWGFFILSHGWTWICWSIPLLSGGNVWNYPNVVFIYLGGIGPPLAGIVMTGLMEGHAGLIELGWRIVDIRRIKPGWYLVIFVLIPAIAGIAIVIDLLLGSSAQALNFGPVLAQLAHPFKFLLFAVFMLLFGPLPEEIGWRGYALDRLQARYNALTASVILGAAWGLWHVPLFFLEGYYARFGEAPEPIGFMYDIIIISVLYTWIYNHTRRSILAAILFHFMVNFTGELLPTSAQVDLYKTVLTSLFVIFVVWRYGPKTLGGKSLRTA